MSRSDIVVAVILIALAAGGGLVYRRTVGGGSVSAEIYFDGQLIQVVELGDEAAVPFSIPEAPSVAIRQENGGILFESSDCPDQICVRTGRITLPGSFAACLPNKVLIQIVLNNAANSDDVDIILR